MILHHKHKSKKITTLMQRARLDSFCMPIPCKANIDVSATRKVRKHFVSHFIQFVVVVVTFCFCLETKIMQFLQFFIDVQMQSKVKKEEKERFKASEICHRKSLNFCVKKLLLLLLFLFCNETIDWTFTSLFKFAKISQVANLNSKRLLLRWLHFNSSNNMKTFCCDRLQ